MWGVASLRSSFKRPTDLSISEEGSATLPLGLGERTIGHDVEGYCWFKRNRSSEQRACIPSMW